MRIVLVIGLITILVCLAAAVYFMLQRPNNQLEDTTPEDSAVQRSRQMARALTWRITLSISVFIFILLGWWMGWLQPGIVPLNK